MRILTSRTHLVPVAAAIVLLATLVAALVDAQFHQVIHERGLWMVLAMQEAIWLKTMAVRKRFAPRAALNASRGSRGAALVRSRTLS